MKRLIIAFQDGFARLLGLAPATRTSLVHSMLHRPRGDAAGYWLQLLIAATLATLGLALDSTAVVIGAMLIAPLMRPIVELAMGLATGSPPLVLRTGVRAVVSVAVVVGASALFTWLLPFHDITSELRARTSPSLIDLFVAAACALAGAYAVVIASNDVATTAAGTSIGISLVPPLCTAGYGLSIGDWHMAEGAGLLFTANVCGIVVVASALFVLVGFGQVNIREEERSLDENTDLGAATRLGRNIAKRSVKLGATVRVLIPLLLVAAVVVPLQTAVREMARRSRVRNAVAAVIERASTERVVQYSLEQSGRTVSVRAVVVGDPADASALDARLRALFAELDVPYATVAVWAVPDSAAMTALSARVDELPALFAPPPPPVVPPPPSLEARVRAAWPSQNVAAPVAVWAADGPPPRVRVVHLGPELGATGRELLGRAVALDGVTPVIDDLALVPVELTDDGISDWLARALALLGRASEFPEVHFCVGLPPRPARGRRDPIPALVRDSITAGVGSQPNAFITSSDVPRLVPTLDACEPPAPTPPPP